MWKYIISAVIVFTFFGMLYLAFRVSKFRFLSMIFAKKYKVYILSIGIVALIIGIIYFLLGMWNAAICVIHAMLIWSVCDLFGIIIKKIFKLNPKIYVSGIIALSVTVIYLSVGTFCAHHVFRTEYTLETEKDIGENGIKIVAFSDSHIGTTFDWQEFEGYAEQMDSENPDILVIVGDFADNNTSEEDLENCIIALGKIKTTYGIYYVFGNHDRSFRYGGKTKLISLFEENGIIVLDDETVKITENVYLCGRNERKNIFDLTNEVPDDAYLIVLNHKPNDYASQSARGVDLVISGHTHGGQFIPINKVGELIGENDFTYGHKTVENTDFIVSSGIADWEFDFKTGCISEYLVINIKSRL